MIFIKITEFVITKTKLQHKAANGEFIEQICVVRWRDKSGKVAKMNGGGLMIAVNKNMKTNRILLLDLSRGSCYSLAPL